MGKFETGNKHGKGRPKGWKPKKLLRKAEETLVELGFNPIVFLVNLCQDPKTSPETKAKIAIELNALVNPKAKPPEDGQGGPDEEDMPGLPDDPNDLKKLTPHGKRSA